VRLDKPFFHLSFTKLLFGLRARKRKCKKMAEYSSALLAAMDDSTIPSSVIVTARLSYASDFSKLER
jgi:hypothetical protein